MYLLANTPSILKLKIIQWFIAFLRKPFVSELRFPSRIVGECLVVAMTSLRIENVIYKMYIKFVDINRYHVNYW